MQENTISNFEPGILADDNGRTWFPTVTRCQKSEPPKFPPDEDIELWLKHNAPLSFQQLADIRYALYHRCTRNDYFVARATDDQFSLIGRHSTLEIVSDNARQYLLWRLRLLGRKKKWISALLRTKNPRR